MTNEQPPKQLTEPLDYPEAEIQALCNALNAANDALRSYFRSRNIPFNEEFFQLVEHSDRPSLLEAAHQYDREFLHNTLPLMAKKPSGPVQ